MKVVSRKKVSIIEDDITMRNLLQTLLKLEGFLVSIHTPSSIAEVLEQIVDQQPDAVLLDVHLKNINGLDVAKQLRQATDIIRQPLIIMASGMDLAVEAKKAGADHFLLKPYMPDTLISWLNEHLNLC